MNVVADNGTSILVARGTSGIDFVDASTGAFQQTAATSAKVNAIAVAPARIWYVTQSTRTNFVVGWMALDGTSTNSVTKTPSSGEILNDTGGFSAIIPDLTPPNDKAWLLYQNNSNATYIWSFTITGSNAGTLGNPLTLSTTLSYSAALGSDNNLYVTNSSGNIHKVSLGTDPANLVNSFSTTGSCTQPFGIISSGSTLYFSARLGNRVCSMTQAGVVTAGNAATTPNGLAFDSAGGLWAASGGGGLRLTNASPLNAAIPGGAAANAIKLANGYLWVTSNNALWRVTTQ
jgi:hypothetical protein